MPWFSLASDLPGVNNEGREEGDSHVGNGTVLIRFCHVSITVLRTEHCILRQWYSRYNGWKRAGKSFNLEEKGRVRRAGVSLANFAAAING